MYEAGTGAPIIAAGGQDNMFGGGLSSLLIGALLFGGNGGIGGFGMNRGLGGVPGTMPGYGVGGYGYGGGSLGGYVVGSAEGGQTAGIGALQQQVSQIANTQGQDRIAGEIDEVEGAIGNLGTSTAAGFADIQSSLASIGRDYNNLFGQVNANIATGNFSTLNSINGLGRDVTAQANNNALQQLNSFNVLGASVSQGFNNVQNATQVGFNNVNTSMLNGFNAAAFNTQNSFNSLNNNMMQGLNEVGRDINTATTQLIAGQNAASAQMAACCCEIKETVRTDGGLTRALINDIRLSELNAALTDAKVEVSNLRQTNNLAANNAAQTSVILQHISPILASLQNNHNHWDLGGNPEVPVVPGASDRSESSRGDNEESGDRGGRGNANETSNRPAINNGNRHSDPTNSSGDGTGTAAPTSIVINQDIDVVNTSNTDSKAKAQSNPVVTGSSTATTKADCKPGNS